MKPQGSDDPSACSRHAIVTAVSRIPARKTTIVIAEDPGQPACRVTSCLKSELRRCPRFKLNSRLTFIVRKGFVDEFNVSSNVCNLLFSFILR